MQWIQKSELTCVALYHIPNKATNLHNRSTCETPLRFTEKDVIGLQQFRSPRNSTSHPPGLRGFRKQAGTREGCTDSESRLGPGVPSRNGEKTEGRNNAAGVKQEHRRAADEIRTEIWKHFPGERAHLPLATTPIWRNGVCAHAVKSSTTASLASCPWFVLQKGRSPSRPPNVSYSLAKAGAEKLLSRSSPHASCLCRNCQQ